MLNFGEKISSLEFIKCLSLYDGYVNDDEEIILNYKLVSEKFSLYTHDEEI